MTSPTKGNPPQAAVAPVWHTCAVLGSLAVFSALSAYLKVGSSTPRIGHVPYYSMVLVFEWALFAFCLRGSSPAFAAYVSRALRAPRSLLLDLPVAVLLAASAIVISPVMIRILGRTGWVSLDGMHPHNPLETALWIAMSITAGICEETIFRGYLQQQFSSWAGHRFAGLLAQAVIFGLCHAYQGWKNMALISALGCIFGAGALLRKGLRANIIAHATIDIFGAF
jgi:membrane protease YdiL (CAAX protease family)